MVSNHCDDDVQKLTFKAQSKFFYVKNIHHGYFNPDFRQPVLDEIVNTSIKLQIVGNIDHKHPRVRNL